MRKRIFFVQTLTDSGTSRFGLHTFCNKGSEPAMGPIKTRAWGLGLLLVGVVSVAADADTPPPSSLRMRASAAKPVRWSPMRWAKRVAQVAPATADDPAPQSAEPSS